MDLPDQLLANTFLMRWKPLGANPSVAPVSIRPQTTSLIDSSPNIFSTSQAYDQEFALRTSTHPDVSPHDYGMAKIKVPVSPWQKTYEAYLLQSLPNEQQIDQARIEHWMAATGRFFVPAKPHQLEIRTAVGPAIFSQGGKHMLQVGIVAGSADPGDRPPNHMTVAVTPPDTSTYSQARWQLLRIALQELVTHLGPHDTLSLVVLSQYPRTVVEDVTHDNRETWLAAVDQIGVDKTPNLAEGVRQAAAVALTKPGFGDIRRSVVVISDRFPTLNHRTAAPLGPLIESAASEGLDFTWIQTENELFQKSIQRPSVLASTGHWQVTDSLQSIDRQLQQALYGQSPQIGQVTSLKVHWNKNGVDRYRLIGYQPHNPLSSAATESSAFFGRETSSVLFEITLPEPGENRVAEIELQWQDTLGKTHRSQQSINQIQFAASWKSSPLSLQAAQLAVQSLNLKQNSYDVRRHGQTVDELIHWSNETSSSLREHISYDRLKLLLQEPSR